MTVMRCSINTPLHRRTFCSPHAGKAPVGKACLWRRPGFFSVQPLSRSSRYGHSMQEKPLFMPATPCRPCGTGR